MGAIERARKHFLQDRRKPGDTRRHTSGKEINRRGFVTKNRNKLLQEMKDEIAIRFRE